MTRSMKISRAIFVGFILITGVLAGLKELLKAINTY